MTTLLTLIGFALTAACDKQEPLARQQAPVAASRGNQSDLAEVVIIIFLLRCDRAREKKPECSAFEQAQQELKKKIAEDSARHAQINRARR
jgi:hypothetical protein